MEGSCCKEHSNERSSLWRALPLSNSITLSALMAFYLISTGRRPLNWRLLRTALPASHLFLAPGVFCPDFSLLGGEGGGWKKHGYSGLAWQWRAEPSQGWALAKSWSAAHRGSQARTDKIKFLSLSTLDQRHHAMDVITTIDYLRYSYCFGEVTWQEARFDASLIV